RYLSGDEIEVWNELHAFSVLDPHDARIEDARKVVSETMRRVKINLETLVARLTANGYVFIDTCNRNGTSIPLTPPDARSHEILALYRELLGPLPLTMSAWIEQVGDVSLLGHNPNWEPPRVVNDTFYPDPMVVDFTLGAGRPSRSAISLEEYKIDLEDKRDDILSFTKNADLNVREYNLDYAPDYCTKQGYSGGAPYCVYLPDAAVDAWTGNEEYFVDYVRRCFSYGGFDGYPKPELHLPTDLVMSLTEGLLPI
ncbi:MAG TPA: hypothetical protein P5307_25135, partial [Pirellulaceae bacterium]|nr:hypothetical protein [Pirellulaceae bacterium]